MTTRPTLALEQRIYSSKEYLEFELTSEVRNEFRQGVIVPMTGGTPNHNELVVNLASLLKIALKGQPYRTFAMDQRLWVPDRSLYTYPDVIVVEKPLQLQTGRTDTVINPCFMAEVLSKSTQNYDHGEKFTAYRTIKTFREYLLIDQYKVHVEHYSMMAPNQWLRSEYTDIKASLSLFFCATRINIIDLYENIDFLEN